MWIYVLAGAPVILYLLWKWVGVYNTGNDDYWLKRGVPRALPSEIPGSWKVMIGTKPFHDVDNAQYNKYPDVPYVGVMEARTPLLLIRDPELVKKITIKDFDHFINRREFSIGGDLADDFLFSMSGARWKSMRAAISPAFSSGKIRRMFEYFEKSSKQLADFILKKNEKNDVSTKSKSEAEIGIIIEPREAFARFSMDVIGSIAFGIDSQCLIQENSPFYENGNLLQKVGLVRIFKIVFMTFFPKLSRLIRLQFFATKAVNFFTSIITRHLDARRENYRKTADNSNRKSRQASDFLDLMIQAQTQEVKEENEQDDELAHFERDARVQNAKKEPVTDNFIISTAFGFFVGGFDNTEAVLSAAAYHLAVNPQYQERLREEVDQIVAEHDGQVTYDGVAKMTYLDMFLSECLRINAPVIRYERKVTKEYTIPKIGDYPEVTLPVGSVVFFPVLAFHKDPKHWPNPDVFDPERFNPENKAKRHPYVYMPFGHGPRSCIAMRFVLTEMKAAIAHLVHQFEIQTCKDTPVPMKLQDLQGHHRPAADIKLAIVKRN